VTIPPSVSEEEWEVFLAETQEQIEGLETSTLRLEQDDGDPELLREMFRLAHTIKGSSAAVGLDSMARLTHAMESLLDKLRSGQMEVRPPLVDALFQGCDLLQRLVVLPTQTSGEEPPVDPLIERLLRLAEHGGETVATAQPVASRGGDSGRPAASSSAPTGGTAVAEAPTAVAVQPVADAPAPDRELGGAASASVRIDVERLDTLMELIGELVIDRARIEQIATRWAASARTNVLRTQLSDVSLHLRRTLDDLRDEVLKSRMVPVSSVLRRLPRVVRDLARASGKQVELNIDGEETELDRSVVDELADPLVHLVRNAVDHGIESPAERQAQGKPAGGTIHILARHDENQILIELKDDGRGVDVDRVREVAISRGLVTQDAANRMSESDLIDLIFVPGFSTASSVTAVSGRGVGMDIVRSRIERVNGSITVNSLSGEGTHFMIRLPLTLAIIRGLLVTLRDSPYAIPLATVAEVVRIPREQVRSVGRRPAIELRGEVLPLVWLDELLAVPSDGHERQSLIAVSVRIGGRRIGVIVDGLGGEQDVVIKPLGSFIGKARGIAGATILVDGRVCPILNIAGLLTASTASLTQSEAS